MLKSNMFQIKCNIYEYNISTQFLEVNSPILSHRFETFIHSVITCGVGEGEGEAPMFNTGWGGHVSRARVFPRTQCNSNKRYYRLLNLNSKSLLKTFL